MRYAEIDAQGLARCPVHRMIVGRIDKGGKAVGVFLWCKACRAEVAVDTRPPAERAADTSKAL